MSAKLVLVLTLAALARADPSASDVLRDIYHSCLKDFSVSCVKPKALSWMSYVSDKPQIHITEDLVLVKKRDAELGKCLVRFFGLFEDFLQRHVLGA